MDDQVINLLEAIDARLATETATGQTLEDIDQYFVKYTKSDVPPEIGSQNTILMVDVLTVPGKVISIPACMTEKQAPIRFTIFTEEAGDTTQKTAAELIDLVEDIFFPQSFNITQWVDMTQKDYSQPESPPFEAPHNSGASIILTHTYTDVREIPIQG